MAAVPWLERESSALEIVGCALRPLRVQRSAVEVSEGNGNGWNSERERRSTNLYDEVGRGQ